MKKNKIFSRLMILGFFAFGILSVNAQTASSETWEIVVTNFSNQREGCSFTINGTIGGFAKVETRDGGKTNTRNAEMLKEKDVQEISDLIGKLNLGKTTSETIAGRGDNKFPYWSVSIEVGNKVFMMEGAFLSDMKISSLNNEQKAVYEKLKAKLSEIGVVFPKKADVNSSNKLNLPIGFSLPLDPKEQKMVFRIEYLNNTDGFEHKGWYIDESGKIYKYSYSLTKNPQNPNSFDFGFKMLPTFVGQVNLEELAKRREILKKIERGKYTEKKVAFDKPTSMFSAFLPDSETGKYRLLQLAAFGGEEGINDAPEVEELIVWLKSVIPAG